MEETRRDISDKTRYAFLIQRMRLKGYDVLEGRILSWLILHHEVRNAVIIYFPNHLLSLSFGG
jgi:hypothetical protein